MSSPGALRARAKRLRGLEPADDPASVECLICGKRFRAITQTHLRRAHDFEGDNPVRDYLAQFGLMTAVCEKTRELMAEAWHDESES